MIEDRYFLLFIPLQLTPFPLYPWLQAQVKLPIVLVHIALESQLSVLIVHSSISAL